jgi:hypothetical protein
MTPLDSDNYLNLQSTCQVGRVCVFHRIWANKQYLSSFLKSIDPCQMFSLSIRLKIQTQE